MSGTKTDRGLIGILVLAIILLGGCENQLQLTEQRILQFGTVIDISLLHSDTDKAELALVAVERQLARYRGFWHAWEDSDLYRFNQSLAEAETVAVPESLRELIDLSQHYYHRSYNLFNPALGKLIAAYGFHGTAGADHALIDTIKQDLPVMPDLVVEHNRASTTNPHLQLDFGGIAKGYAMSLVADFLKNSGYEHFLINAGGDLVVSGNHSGKPWVIGIQNPFAPGAIAKIKLNGEQYLFTSGNYQRYYQQGDQILHHIIDPRTGAPSQHISSATVLVDDAVLADIAATTLMIDGWNAHNRLSKSLGIEDYLIVNESKEIIVSRSLYNKIELTTDTAYTIID